MSLRHETRLHGGCEYQALRCFPALCTRIRMGLEGRVLGLGLGRVALQVCVVFRA